MERRTNLSGEFSGGCNPEKEFAKNPPEEATSGFGEFNGTNDGGGEFNEACRDIEFSAAAVSEQSSKSNRREKRRRNLLLQAAAVGLSVVLVTNSFDIDILGGTAQINESDFSKLEICKYTNQEGYAYGVWWEGAQNEYSRYKIVAYGEDREYEVLSEAQWRTELGDSVYYDREANTLFLNDCELGGITIYHMALPEHDFSIYVDGCVKIDNIFAHDSNINIFGTPGSAIYIGPLPDIPSFYRGITIQGNGAVNIGSGITVEIVDPECAIEIHGTEKSPGIVFDESKTSVSGAIISGDLFEDSTYDIGYEFESNLDWTVVDENGDIAAHVIFSPK